MREDDVRRCNVTRRGTQSSKVGLRERGLRGCRVVDSVRVEMGHKTKTRSKASMKLSERGGERAREQVKDEDRVGSLSEEDGTGNTALDWVGEWGE